MRSLNHPALDDVSLTQVLYALSDPERLRVVHLNDARTSYKALNTLVF